MKIGMTLLYGDTKRRLMRSVIRDLVGGELNAWTLTSRRIVDAMDRREKTGSPDFV